MSDDSGTKMLFYRGYIMSVKMLRKMLPEQITKGWVDKEDLITLEMHDNLIKAFDKALLSEDLIELASIEANLNETMIQLSKEIIASKEKNFDKIKASLAESDSLVKKSSGDLN